MRNRNDTYSNNGGFDRDAMIVRVEKVLRGTRHGLLTRIVTGD
jgi:hypothetical protein